MTSAPGTAALDGPFDGVGGSVTLLDCSALGNADDDVGEMAPGSAAHPQPPELHARLELLDRGLGAPRALSKACDP